MNFFKNLNNFYYVILKKLSYKNAIIFYLFYVKTLIFINILHTKTLIFYL